VKKWFRKEMRAPTTIWILTNKQREREIIVRHKNYFRKNGQDKQKSWNGDNRVAIRLGSGEVRRTEACFDGGRRQTKHLREKKPARCARELARRFSGVWAPSLERGSGQMHLDFSGGAEGRQAED